MYLGYDKDGNIVRHGHGEAQFIGATQKVPVTKIISDRNNQLAETKKPGINIPTKISREFLIYAGLAFAGWWFFIKEKSRSRYYNPYEDDPQYRDYITGVRKQLPKALLEAETPYRGTSELTDFQKQREKRRYERIEELKKRRQEFLYRGDREV